MTKLNTILSTIAVYLYVIEHVLQIFFRFVNN